MRNLIVVALWAALGTQAADVPSEVIDLDPPGVLEALKQDKPIHYAKVLETMEKMQAMPYTPSGQMDLRTTKTGNPTNTRLTVPVDGKEYQITVIYTKNPALNSPAK